MKFMYYVQEFIYFPQCQPTIKRDIDETTDINRVKEQRATI